MKKNEKKKESESQKESNDSTMESFAEFILENYFEKSEATESFEIYAHELKSHLYRDREHFRKRFREGYHCLNDLLKQR